MAEGTAITTKSVKLPESVSDEIWQKAQEESVVMQLAQPIALPGNGLTIPVVTGDPVAEWVGEGDESPVGSHSLTTKTMRGYTLSLIEAFSNKFRDDDAALYEALLGRLPGSISKAFDQTVYGFRPSPGEGFDTLAGAAAVDVSKPYDGFVDAVERVGDADGDLSYWVLSPKARTMLLRAKDTQARPLFVSQPAVEGAPSSVLAIPATFSKAVRREAADGAPEVVGFGGDWTAARYGVVRGISIALADQASLSVQDGNDTKQLNLFQRRMFAVSVEFEIGFVVRDVSEFVRLEDGTASTAASGKSSGTKA